MNQWIGLAVICLAGWGIAELVMRGTKRFASIGKMPKEPPKEMHIKCGDKWFKYTRHDAAEADANNKAWDAIVAQKEGGGA